MLTVLLPENGHSAGLRQLLMPLLPAGSVCHAEVIMG